MPKVLIDIEHVVRVTENHGGYLGAKCLLCGEGGWLRNKYGYAYGTKEANASELIHKKSCAMNKYAI